MNSILIVGYGMVGQKTFEELKSLKPDIYDKYKVKENSKKKNFLYDFAFICVDTPLNSKGLVDTTEVENAIKENDALVYVIKSTVPVGFVDDLSSKTMKAIVMSPEYWGSTHHSTYDFNFLIVGGEKVVCEMVVQLYQKVFDGRHKFLITSAKLAELVKFMENAWLAYKVSFMTQFWEISKQAGVSYTELRELFLQDPRVHPANTLVYSDHPFWSSHCYNKDVPSIANQFDAKLLKEMMKFNQLMKKKYGK